MKNIPLLLLFLISVAGGYVSAGAEVNKINAQDTIVFDLSKVTYADEYASVPVYILSDDTVNAVDFSFRFNEGNLYYDSTITLAANLSALYFFNPSDNTYRFTSNSFIPIESNKTLLQIRFIMLFGKREIYPADFNTIKGYLNGDLCSVKVINGILTGVRQAALNKETSSIYPNPASTLLVVDVAEKSTIQLFDIHGKQVIAPTVVSANQKHEISTENIANGIFLMKITSENFDSVKQVVISK